MRKTKRQQVAPRHTSEQRYSPEFHAELTEELNAEIRRRNTEPTKPMPRYELNHTSHNPTSRDYTFTLSFQANSPSAALAFAHHIAERLAVQIHFRDKHTGQELFISMLSSTDL